MVKKRSSSQQKGSSAENIVEEALDDFIVNKMYDDFGIDFHINLTEDAGDDQIVTSTEFYVQVKSSENYDDPDWVAEDISTDDLVDFNQRYIPVALIFYDHSKDEIYWQMAQKYIRRKSSEWNNDWYNQGNKRIKIPRENTLPSINELREIIEEEHETLSKKKFLEIKFDPIIENAKWNLRSIIEDKEARGPFSEEIKRAQSDADELLERLRSISSDTIESAAEITKLLERAKRIRTDLEQILLSEPELTRKEVNPFYTDERCNNCNGKMTKPFIDSDELVCTNCEYLD